MKVKKLATLAVLTAAALGLHVLESQLPDLVPIPGVKLGLSNIVTMFTVFAIGGREGAAVLYCRILLGTLLSGAFSSVFFAVGGGLCAILTTVGMRRVVSEKQIWIVGILAAMAHALGQLAVAVLLSGTPYSLLYLPILLFFAIFTGLLTGLCTQLLLNRGKNLWKTFLQ